LIVWRLIDCWLVQYFSKFFARFTLVTTHCFLIGLTNTLTYLINYIMFKQGLCVLEMYQIMYSMYHVYLKELATVQDMLRAHENCAFVGFCTYLKWYSPYLVHYSLFIVGSNALVLCARHLIFCSPSKLLVL